LFSTKATSSTSTSKKKQKKGINEITKAQIALCYSKRLTTASFIIIELRDRKRQFLPKKYETDENVNNPNYVPGIVPPTPQQINNYLNRTYRPKFYECSSSSKRKFCYSDLAIWFDKNTIDLTRINKLNTIR
jgi:hypothetical protein